MTDSSGGAGPEQYPDLETELEEEMAASGRTGFVPRAGLVGAHEQRKASLAAALEVDDPGEPAGPGAEVAPTRRAVERERERHQRERELGVIPAGDGRLRQQRAPGVTRESLDRASSEADRRVADGALDQRGRTDGSPAPSPPWQERIGPWLRENRQLLAGVSGAAVITACLLYVGRRR